MEWLCNACNVGSCRLTTKSRTIMQQCVVNGTTLACWQLSKWDEDDPRQMELYPSTGDCIRVEINEQNQLRQCDKCGGELVYVDDTSKCYCEDIRWIQSKLDALRSLHAVTNGDG